MLYYQRLNDSKIIKYFLTDPDLWKRISETEQVMGDFTPVINDLIHWVGLYEDDRLFGMLIIHPENSVSALVHINILHNDRYKLSKQAGNLCLDYMINKTDYQKFHTKIPIIYDKVMKFVEYFGFTVEGIQRMSINKNNILVDQILYGITRKEIGE